MGFKVVDMHCRVSLVALSLLGLPAYHAAIIGRAISIYDGDTFKVNETATGMVFRIRMHGIDAPELSQLCVGADGADYPCGKVTQQALVNLIGSAPVKCEVQTTDKYNRSVSLCWGNEGAVDLGQQLVSSGLAFAYRQYSDLYVPAEESAKAAKLGMWAGSFMFPWDWRRQQSSNDTNTSTPPDPDCAIKGNIGSDKQKIYHVPGSRFYNTTSIDESAGERWFCSAYEAEIAGWRPSGCAVKGDIASNGDRVYFISSSPDYSSVVVDVTAGERWFCSSAEAEIAGWRPAGCPIKGDIASNGEKVYFTASAQGYSSITINVTAGERWFCSSSDAEVAGWRPAGCPIKGDITASGDKVYHAPNGTEYNTVSVNVTAGERWFCSSTEAEVAGWRPAGCAIKGDMALNGERIYYTPTSAGYSTVSVNVTAGEHWFCTAWDAEVASWRPVGCPIKGNINSAKEKIYHVPGGRYYSSTVIDVTQGEKWFCTESQAVAAGWRKSSARRHRLMRRMLMA